MCTTVATALVAAIAALSPTSAQAFVTPDSLPEPSVKFAAFMQEHGRRYEAGSAEHAKRYAHFQERLAKVEAHNSKTDRTWTAAVNALADQTPEELDMLRGYRRSAGRGAGRRSSSLGLLSTSVHAVNVSHLPVSFSWGGQLEATKLKNVKDQGACGSCWAISSAAVLRAHAELYQQDRTFSTQQIVECTPNPQECGGQGGCKGATAELAMEYVTTQGLLTEEEHAYKATDAKCPANLQVPSESGAAKHESFLSIAVRKGKEHGGLNFGMSGWTKLPENLAEPLLLALYEKGPVVVSVAATDSWSMYSKGVMSACQEGAVINHAVVLIGYGVDNWQIQNSWGPAWGEAGTVRLLRHEGKEENKYCGWDTKPSDGTACKGGPDKVWVCGSCGVLYDSVVPNFALSKSGFLSRHQRGQTGIFTQISSATSV